MTMLDHAMQYAGMGWYIFPVWWVDENGHCACGAEDCADPDKHSIGKHPITRRGCWEASTDAKQIYAWWRDYPNANIGLHCGPSGLIVLDLDKYKEIYLPQAVDRLMGLEDEATVTSLTPSGGVHLFYATNKVYGNSRKSLPPGIDVRANGAYVVLPPSNHRLGVYRWENDYGPGEIGFRPLPPKFETLLDMLATEQKRARARAAERVIEVAPEMETLAYALSFIPNWSLSDRAGGLEYREWLAVLMAVHSLYPGQDGIDLIESWSPGHDGEVAAKFASFHSDGVTLGTLEYVAKAHGWPGSFSDHYDGFSPIHTPNSVFHPEYSEQVAGPGNHAGADDGQDDGQDDGAPTPTTGIYQVMDGRIQFYERAKGPGGKWKPVCDLTAAITGEITNEHGEKTYVISGRGVRGGPYSVEIAAEEFGQAGRLRARMDAISPYDGIYHGMGDHLAMAIKVLSADATTTRRYNRTGWQSGRFLIPGREPAGVEVKLDPKAAYDVSTPGDMQKATTALAALIDGIGPYGSTVIAYTLLGPLAALCGWRHNRFGLFIRGVTGSMKTTSGRLSMALWGREFARDELFEKMGDNGGTPNGIIGRAAEIADLPFMIDNFKPNTQKKDVATGLIHALMEGYTKSRQNRAGENVRTIPLLTWPLMTGEDIPGDDTATLARLSIIDLEAKNGIVPPGIVTATDLADHLHLIGAAWLDLLEGPNGPAVVALAQRTFERERIHFAEHIRTHSPRAQNMLRSATNFALLSAVWSALAEVEPIADLVVTLADGLQVALLELAGNIEQHTGDHLEGNVFLQILAQLISTNRLHIVPMGKHEAGPSLIPTVGWYDDMGNICLHFDLALHEVQKVNPLNGMKKGAIYAQLRERDALAIVGKEKTTLTLNDPLTGKKARVLVLKSAALGADGEIDQDITPAELAREIGL